MTTSPNGSIRLSPRDLLLLLAAWGSLAGAWAVTAVGVHELSLEVAAIRTEAATDGRQLYAHENLPWHSGYAATLPAAVKTLEDIQARLRELENDNRRSLGRR